MKRLTLILLSYFIVFSTFSQKRQSLTVEKKNGEQIVVNMKLKKYEGEHVILDGFNTSIKGRLKDKSKIEIKKTEISRILLNDSIEYQVLEDKSRSYIGYYLVQGNLSIFKTYSLEAFGGTIGPSTSVIVAKLYEVKGKSIIRLNKGKKLKTLMKECPELKDYVKKNSIVKQDEYIFLAFNYYNQICGKE